MLGREIVEVQQAIALRSRRSKLNIVPNWTAPWLPRARVVVVKACAEDRATLCRT
jgi:hypothetical protein